MRYQKLVYFLVFLPVLFAREYPVKFNSAAYAQLGQQQTSVLSVVID